MLRSQNGFVNVSATLEPDVEHRVLMRMYPNGETFAVHSFLADRACLESWAKGLLFMLLDQAEMGPNLDVDRGTRKKDAVTVLGRGFGEPNASRMEFTFQLIAVRSKCDEIPFPGYKEGGGS